MTDEEVISIGGAIDIRAASCPKSRRFGRSRMPHCRCERCAVCGDWKHIGEHGAVYGQPVGSEPWGHAFVPARPQNGGSGDG